MLGGWVGCCGGGGGGGGGGNGGGRGGSDGLHGVSQVRIFVLTSQKAFKDMVFSRRIINGPQKALIGGKVI
jgi:hypothetical protein